MRPGGTVAGMKTVLVTGGSGFLGGWCLVELLRGDYAVRTTVRDLGREAEVRARVESQVDPGDRLSFFVADLSERLETRKQVDRAKGVLQERLGLSEPESFRWIQKTAMDLRLSMRQVAEGVVQHGPGLTGDAPAT